MSIPFFTPGLMLTSIGVSCIFNPFKTALYGVTGAIQGSVGAYALTTLGYGACGITTAATIGFLAGAAIAAPFAIALSLKSIFESADEVEHSIYRTIAGFVLEIAGMFLASYVISTALFLGTIPAIAVATGALITNSTVAMIKDDVGFCCEYLKSNA